MPAGAAAWYRHGMRGAWALVLAVCASARAASPVLPVRGLSAAPAAAASAAAITASASLSAAPRALAAPHAELSAPAVLPAGTPLFAGAGLYEQRGAGLLVVDVKDSTRLHLELSNRKAHAAVMGALDYAEDSASLFDGKVVRRLGDGYLIAFPSFARALSAAAAIQGGFAARPGAADAPALQLRAGAHSGRILIDAEGAEPDVYGQSVERALALADKSRGGDVALDPELPDAAVAEAFPARVDVDRVDGALLIRPPAPAAPPGPAPGGQPRVRSARFVQAATLFASLADWPGMYDAHGRRPAYRTTKAFHAYARAAVERHGGLYVKNEGETVMAVFPDRAGALRAAADLQARFDELRAGAPLGELASARVGLTWGRILREDSLDGVDFFGNSVNAAARLMRRAVPGEVAMGAVFLEDPEAAALLTGARRESVTVKGFPQPLDVLRIRPTPD